MAVLSALFVYPIKSCAGIAVREAVLTRAGLAVDALADRQWMLVDASGRFLTQREHPRMALVAPRLAAGALALRAPGMPELEIAPGPLDPGAAPALAVRIWDDVVNARDCGDAAAAWFSRAIGAACRLVRFDPAARRYASAAWTGAVAAPTLFSDGFPVLVVGSASLADLNSKLRAGGRAPLPMNRFRPNLVIDGLDAFAEDYVDTFALGAARLENVKPCARCVIPAVDQATGLPGPDPLDILQTYRACARLGGAVSFGMNSIVTAGEGERLRVGQDVGWTLAF